MDLTAVSLLQRLQRGNDPESWNVLVAVYLPLIRGWLSAQGAPAQDLDDLTQDVLLILLRELPQFRHNGRPGAFRAWLRAVAANRLRTHWRAKAPAAGPAALDGLDDPGSEPNVLWDRQHDQHVLSQLLALAQAKFEPATFQAFRRVTLDGATPAQAAAELQMSVPAVYIAKSRVLRRLREQADGLLD